MPTVAICSAFDLITPIVLGEPTIYFPRTAKINIRSYLAPRLEYQYPGESKQTIFSNGGELSYTTNQEVGQCPTWYSVRVYYKASNTRSSTCGALRYCIDRLGQRDIKFNGKFKGLDIDFSQIGILNPDGSPTGVLGIKYESNTTGQIEYTHPKSIQSSFIKPRSSCRRESGTDTGFALQNTWYWDTLRRLDGQPDDCGDCIFIVTETFDDGSTETRHQETRDICPTVQQFDCELGDEIQTITVKLDSFEALFASDGTDFDNPLVEFFDINSDIVNYFSGNPDNCLLIWAVRRPFVNNAFLTGEVPVIRQIAQICSAPGCPPPEFNHECFGDCEKCPDNTCPVMCGDRVCCYDESGKAVKEIPKENYCD